MDHTRDADVLGNRATLELLGQLAGTRPRLFPLKPPTNEIGVVITYDASGAPGNFPPYGRYTCTF